MNRTTRVDRLHIAFYNSSVRSMDEQFPAITNSTTVEMRVYMHCDACERSVRRAITKIEGVVAVEVERDENKVAVTGDFDPEEVVRKIKKKTGKKAEILIPEEEEEEDELYQDHHAHAHAHAWACAPYGVLVRDQGAVACYDQFQRPARWDLHCFDDENTEACRVM